MLLKMSDFEKISKEVAAESTRGPGGGFIYKYCRVRTAVQIFQSGGVLLDSAKNFNDPFEGRAAPKWPDDDVLRQHIKATSRPDKWHEVCEEALRRKSEHPDQFPLEVLEEVNKIGVSCFSEIRDNLLMWGHYADKHQGVCIGFRYRGIMDNLVLRFSETEIACVPSKVAYSDEFPVWEIASGNHGTNVLNTKARCWEYEREWRIASLGAAGLILPIPREAFSHVIFGAKSSPEGQGRVFSAIVAGNYDITRLTFQRARIAKREYKLELDPWRPDELPSSGVINPFSGKKED